MTSILFRLLFSVCIISFVSTSFYAQYDYEKEFNFKKGVLGQDQIDLIDDINTLDGNNQLEEIVELLSAESISDTVKLTILHIYMIEENLSHPAFNSWLFDNIGFKVDRNIYTPQSFLHKDVYLILKFLIDKRKQTGFTPADLVKSEFFKQCKLFEGWYEKMTLRLLLAEFFISEMGSEYNKLEELIEEPCARENFKAISNICGK